MEIEFFTNLINDYTLRTVLLGATILGITAGSLGVFALLRGQSLLGDAISHASLPGIAGAFLLTGSKNTLLLLCGGGIAGVVGSLCIVAITRYTKIKKDAALGIILSVFFGAGLLLLTYIQKCGPSSQSALNKYLFGNASTLLASDIQFMVVVSAIILVLLCLFWKEFALVTFDPAYAIVLGYRIFYIEALLMLLLVMGVIIGLQCVGVVLMSSLLIAPAAAARQWTQQLGIMVILAACFGACSAIAGVLASNYFVHVPTGPSIVVAASCLVFISLVFGRYRGAA